MAHSTAHRQIRVDRGRWIRLYERLLHTPKIIRLTDHQFRAWVTFLCAADPATGRLPAVSDLAITARLTAKDCHDLVNDLIEARLLDPVRGPDGGCIVIHDWSHWQYKSDFDPTTAERSKRYRRNRKIRLQRDASRVTTVARHAPDTRVEAEAERLRYRGKESVPTSVSSSDTEQVVRGFENRIQDTGCDDDGVVS